MLVDAPVVWVSNPVSRNRLACGRLMPFSISLHLPGAVGDGVVRQLLHLLPDVLVQPHLRHAARRQGDRRVADGPAAGLLVRHRRARADRGTTKKYLI